jgi:transcriptional regulator with XRE-family HTH domain
MTNYQYVLSELPKHNGKFREIAKAVDASYSWISKLANNRIPNPGAVTIDKLADYLRKQPK